MFDGIVKNQELDRATKTESGQVKFLGEEEKEEERFAFLKLYTSPLGSLHFTNTYQYRVKYIHRPINYRHIQPNT